MPAKVPRALKRINARTAIKSWGAFTAHTHGGTVYAINNQVAIPYRWLTQKMLNENPIQMRTALDARAEISDLTWESNETITAISTYSRNRLSARTADPTWTDLPGLQGVYASTASAIRSRSWQQLATWIQLGNAVLVSSTYREQPLAAIVPPAWVDERIDAGAPDVVQEHRNWTSKDSLIDLVKDVARNQSEHKHYDLKAKRHTVTVVDMDWLRQATGKQDIISTTRLPLSMAHPMPNPDDGPQVALVSTRIAAQVLKGTAEAQIKNLPVSDSVDPEEG